MKNMIVTFAAIFFISAASTVWAEYSIIVAANADTSLHLFQHNQDKNMPEIQDVFATSFPISLSTFATHPNEVGEALKPLLDEVITKLEELKVAAVPIQILGTGEMRYISQTEQFAIYSAIKKYIIENYSKSLITKENVTISGKMEGLYHWLDINYLAQHFQKKTPAVGSVDIDGATSTIAFAIPKTIKPIDEINIKINGINYIVFSKSFLGLGLNKARERVNHNPNAASCYPTNAPFSVQKNGKFNLISCRFLYRDLIESYELEKQLVPIYKVPSFIAKEGAYQTYRFFSVDPHAKDQETLEQKTIKPLCGNSWEILKAAFPYEEETTLMKHCGNSIYVTDLLYNAYQINHNQLTIATKINQQEIHWTRGAMLYLLVS